MKKDRVIIRNCRVSDLEEIKVVFKEFVKYHEKHDLSFKKKEHHEEFFADFICANLKSKDSAVFVAEKENEVAGYCLAYIDRKPIVYESPVFGYIDNVAVLEEFQKQGIGELLFLEAKNWFKSNGITRIELFAALTNKKSTRFWRKMGLKPYMEQLYVEV
ncbi:MAG: GNAT family N-acetyltransferase [bacterium]|nr:GNAT family N-acetyltransferase [bacterium]